MSAKNETPKFGESLSGSESPRYSQKEKMHYFSQRSKVGTTDSTGQPLSDFERGRSFGRSEEIGNNLGRFAYSKADESGKAQMRATRADIKASKLQSRADYKAKNEKNVKKK